MITSELSRGRRTIPKFVSEALDLNVGDQIAYVGVEDRVVITKALPETIANRFAIFHECAGAADSKAHAEL